MVPQRRAAGVHGIEGDIVRCGSCGASLTPDMVETGGCGFCGSALPRQAEAPKHVHVTKHVTQVEVRAPDVDVGGCFDSVAARVAGCFSGCVSVAITLLILAFSFGVPAWQLWRADQHDTPTVDHPSHPDKKHKRPKRGR